MTKPMFKFKGKYSESDDTFITVTVQKDEYDRELCTLYKDDHRTEGVMWKIYEIRERSIPDITNERFQTKEQAALFLWSVIGEVERLRNESPLPQKVQLYLIQRAKSLSEQEKYLLSQFWDIRNEQYSLLQFARENKIDRIEWMCQDSDHEAAVRKLLEFEITMEGEEKPIPFFSEKYLYDLLGKDDARTLLSMLRRVCEAVSPNLTSEFL